MIETNLQFHNLNPLKQTPVYLVLHHEAGQGTVEQIHAYHLSKGWSGIAYHAYVRRDGSVYAGRPLNMRGGHCSGHNGDSIGICFEGNFETETMQPAQMTGGVKAITEILAAYPHLQIVGHSELVPTACPGRNFPLEYFRAYQEEDAMTQTEFNRKADNYFAEQKLKPQSEWSEQEGWFDAAREAKLMDGTMPQSYVTREQLAAILGRSGLIK